MKATKLVALGGMLIVLALVGGVWLANASRRDGPLAANTTSSLPLDGLPSIDKTLRDLEGWLPSWQADGELVKLSTTLEKATSSSSWSAQVYAPGRGQIAQAVITEEGVRVIREGTAPYAQQTLATPRRFKGEALLRRWWGEGGAEVWQRPDANSLHLWLGRRSDGIAVWQITVLSTSGELLDFWQARADTGAVLTISSNGGIE
jgi:hypothetical protein